MISEEQLRDLFNLYDRFHGALDPLAPEILEAERAFFHKLHLLHATHAADVPFHAFRRYAVRKCKEFLRKN